MFSSQKRTQNQHHVEVCSACEEHCETIVGEKREAIQITNSHVWYSGSDI